MLIGVAHGHGPSASSMVQAPAPPPQQHIFIRAKFSTQLRILSSMTAEALAKAIDDAFDAMPFRFIEAFEHVGELSCTDAHISNLCAERARQHNMGDATDCLHTLCDVHKCSAMAKRSLGLGAVDKRIVGSRIALPIAMRSSSSWQRLRKALLAILHENTVRKVGGHAGIDA